MRVQEATVTPDQLDFVLCKQALVDAVQAQHVGIPFLLHQGPVVTARGHPEAVFRGVVQPRGQFGRVPHDLLGYAADVHAGSTGRKAGVHEGRFSFQLVGLDRGGEPRRGFGGPIVLGPDDVRAFPEPPAGYDKKRERIPHSQLELIEYDSKTVGTTHKMLVYTPPGYDDEPDRQAGPRTEKGERPQRKDQDDAEEAVHGDHLVEMAGPDQHVLTRRLPG